MRILDRYILKSVLSLFFVCLFTFLFLYVIIDLFSHLDDILKNKVAVDILVKYYLLNLPIIFVQVVPITCLLATLYTFSKLNRDNEIIAIRASGLSIFEITKVLIIFGILISVFIFWINDRFVPSSLSVTQKIKKQIEDGRGKIPEKENETIYNLSMYGLNNRLYFVNQFCFASKTMTGITILEHDEHQNIVKKIVASRGIYEGNFWRFYKTIIYVFDENGQMKEEPLFSEEEMMTISETPRDFLNQRQHPDFMTVAQISDYIWKLSKSGATGVIRNLKVDLYQRFMMPIISLIMILLAIPFSMMVKKRATGLSSIGLSITTGFLYYVLNAVSIALGKAGIIMPLLSASLSHIIICSISIYLISTLP